MAKVIEELSAEGRKYPWEEWSDGQSRFAKRGVDYTCSDKNFQTSLHVRASKMAKGTKAITRLRDDGIAFRFVLPPKKPKKSR
jgi:hypothetical protein